LRHIILNPDDIGFVVALDVADADITERKVLLPSHFWPGPHRSGYKVVKQVAVTFSLNYHDAPAIA
jgi:hypothetical protein